MRKHKDTEEKPYEDTEKKHARRGLKALKITLLVLAVLILILVIGSLLFPKVFNIDRVIRFFRYSGLKDKEGYGVIGFDAGSSNVYGAFDDGLLIGSEGGVVLYDLEGNQSAFVQASLPTPVMRSGETVSLCYSPGTSYLNVIGTGGKILMDETLTGAVLDANVSEDGYVVYTATETGYKAVATVLNPKQEAIYRFSSRTLFLNACAVSEKGTYLALATLGEENSAYQSGITILRTDEALTDLEDSSAIRLDLGNQIVYDLRLLDEKHLIAVCQDMICFYSTDGELLNTISLEGWSILDYDVSDKGFFAIALDQVGGGGTKALEIYDEKGQRLSRKETPDRIRSISVEGAYVGLLTDDSLQIFDKKLDLYFQTKNEHAATKVLMRKDGTALLIGSNTAYLFIP